MILSKPLQQWATVHNLFLLKVVGDYRVGRMQTIHKKDVELNEHCHKFVACCLLQHAEKHSHLMDKQFSG
eukprot:7666486-Ditylum_brightwellii.AAC.1